MVGPISPFSSYYFVDPIRRQDPKSYDGYETENVVRISQKGPSYRESSSSLAGMPYFPPKLPDTSHLSASDVACMLHQIERGFRESRLIPFNRFV